MRENQGNVALVFPVEKPKDWGKPTKRSRKSLSKGLPMGEKLLYLFSVILCVALAAVILTRYAKVTELNMAIRETEIKIEKSKEVNLQLETEKSKLENVERIRKFAEEQGFERKAAKKLPSIRP